MASYGVGFQPGMIFRICSVKDRHCVEVANGSVQRGAPIIVQRWKNSPNQKFKAEAVEGEQGKYWISALLQPSGGKHLVWDYVPGEGLVMQNTASWSINQLWKTERIHPGNNRIFFIKSSEGLCLRHMGKGMPTALAKQAVEDLYQHWIVDPTTSYK